MRHPDPRDIVRRYYEEVISRGEVQRVEDFVGTEYAEVYNGRRSEVGVDGARRHLHGVREVWPDLEVAVGRQVVEGEWVVSCVVARGTHLGVLQTMKPTGRLMEMHGVNVDRVVGGKIVEHGGAANMLEPLLESGAVRVAEPVQ